MNTFYDQLITNNKAWAKQKLTEDPDGDERTLVALLRSIDLVH